jgi:hypothetical protein
MPERRTAKLERLKVPDGQGETCTARFFIRPGSRSRPWVWFDPKQVPPFEEEVGWFEMERIPGGWKILHQVPKPAWER